jgi:tetratricopeptide (TPR) repeat protein
LRKVYSNLGLSRYYQKKFDLAEAAFQAAPGLNAELFVPNLLLGQIYSDKKRHAEALPFVQQAVKKQPGDEAGRHLLATGWLGLGHPEKAIAQYEKLLREDSRDEESLYHLAVIQLELAQHTFALLGEGQTKGFAALGSAEFDAKRPGCLGIDRPGRVP